MLARLSVAEPPPPATAPEAAQIAPPAASPDALSDELASADPLAPLAFARLPKARPEEPVHTGSIARYEDPFPRFRRMHQLRLRYPFPNPYAAWSPHYGYRDGGPRYYRR